MSRRLLPFFVIAALMTIAFPAWSKPAKDGVTATIVVASAENLGNTKLTPGEYRLIATTNQARFERDGKMVAEVPCTWSTLSSKAQFTQVITDNNNQITEIDFGGKTQAIKISPSQGSGN